MGELACPTRPIILRLFLANKHGKFIRVVQGATLPICSGRASSTSVENENRDGTIAPEEKYKAHVLSSCLRSPSTTTLST